jgi:hypothetical protein
MPNITAEPGSDDLLRQVRADFTRKGSSLLAWCHAHGVDHGHAHRVLRGRTNGPSAQALRAQLVAASQSRAA